MAKAIGPSFATEIAVAGLTGLQFSWGADGTLTFGAGLNAGQIAAVQAVYAAHDPTRLDPAVAFGALIRAGVAITSTGTPALNGTYGIAQQDEINIEGLQDGILSGVTWRGFYRDITMRRVNMTAPQFTAIATAILAYISAADEAYIAALGGASWVAPPAPAPIA